MPASSAHAALGHAEEPRSAHPAGGRLIGRRGVHVRPSPGPERRRSPAVRRPGLSWRAPRPPCRSGLCARRRAARVQGGSQARASRTARLDAPFNNTTIAFTDRWRWRIRLGLQRRTGPQGPLARARHPLERRHETCLLISALPGVWRRERGRTATRTRCIAPEPRAGSRCNRPRRRDDPGNGRRHRPGGERRPPGACAFERAFP